MLAIFNGFWTGTDHFITNQTWQLFKAGLLEDSVIRCVLFLINLHFHGRFGILSPHPFKTPLPHKGGLPTDAERLGHRRPRACPGKDQEMNSQLLLSPHCPDDSPEILKSLQSKYRLHNFLVEKVIVLLENADQGRWPLEMRASR